MNDSTSEVRFALKSICSDLHCGEVGDRYDPSIKPQHVLNTMVDVYYKKPLVGRKHTCAEAIGSGSKKKKQQAFNAIIKAHIESHQVGEPNYWGFGK